MTKTPKNRRLVTVALIGAGLAIAAGLTLNALSENVSYYKSPSEVAAMMMASGSEGMHDTRIRLGGLVKDGSVKRNREGAIFTVTDGAQETIVIYNGVLPDLFREGQGVVATGVIDSNGIVQADELLAKHDESYTPPAVTRALENAAAAPSANAVYGDRQNTQNMTDDDAMGVTSDDGAAPPAASDDMTETTAPAAAADAADTQLPAAPESETVSDPRLGSDADASDAWEDMPRAVRKHAPDPDME